MVASGLAANTTFPTRSLADTPLPPRVRCILDAVLAQLQPKLARHLDAATDALEQALFNQAERARSNALQGSHMANLQRLREQRGQLLPGMADALASELAGLRTPHLEPPAPAEIPPMLTLVANDEIDQEIVLQGIARRHEQRHHQALSLLSQRLGVLAGSPALEETQQPLSPQSLCRALRATVAQLDLDLPTQLQFYRLFERQAMDGYGELLEQVGELLSQQGVLPGLVFAPQRARAPAGRIAPPRGSLSPDLPAEPLPAPPQMPLGWTRSPDSTLSRETGSSFASLQRLLSAGQARETRNRQAQPRASAPDKWTTRAPGINSAAGTGHGPAPAAFGDSAAINPGGNALYLTTPTLLDTLQTLQLQVAQGQTPQAATSLQEIRERTLAGLRRAHGPQAQLAQEDQDTFELLDLLYQQIGREVRKGPASDLLGQLQVPMVQAALNDREFFLRPQHPARELLNAVAESGANWLGENDIDPVLRQKLQAAVSRVLTDYTGDQTVFEQVHRQVQDHFQVAARKAEVAERRHVEAARGRDRLELAKRGATELIQASLDGRQAAPVVQDLLTQAWADVLTLILLRSGEDSSQWQQAVSITRDIAGTIGAAQARPDSALATRIAQAFVQAGYHADEAALVAQRLCSSQAPASEWAELPARLRSQPQAQTPQIPGKTVPSPRSTVEQACYDILRQQPFGTWFEFIRNQQGDVHRLRLSWFNPTSGNALFVNQRGQKVGDHTMDGVSRLMARQQARVLNEHRGRLLDRAWQATVSKLRELAGANE